MVADSVEEKGLGPVDQRQVLGPLPLLLALATGEDRAMFRASWPRLLLKPHPHRGKV
jgi:hypothetical protein